MYRKRPPILFPIFPKIGCSLSHQDISWLLSLLRLMQVNCLSLSPSSIPTHAICSLWEEEGGGGFPHTPASHIIRREEGASIPLPFLPLAKWSGKVPMYKTHQCDDGRRYGIRILFPLLKPTFPPFSFPHLLKKSHIYEILLNRRIPPTVCMSVMFASPHRSLSIRNEREGGQKQQRQRHMHPWRGEGFFLTSSGWFTVSPLSSYRRERGLPKEAGLPQKRKNKIYKKISVPTTVHSSFKNMPKKIESTFFLLGGNDSRVTIPSLFPVFLVAYLIPISRASIPSPPIPIEGLLPPRKYLWCKRQKGPIIFIAIQTLSGKENPEFPSPQKIQSLFTYCIYLVE